VPRIKLTGYLLAESHPVGGPKAVFFRNLGFNEQNVRLLEEQLLEIARNEVVKNMLSSAHGTKYVIDGPLETESGGEVTIRTVWIIEHTSEQPRFVTAYPV
jgi:hypothetical protein